MFLRALEPEDLDVLYEIENDLELWEFSNSTSPISRYTLRQYIASCKNDIFEDGQLRMAIDVNGTLVGLIDLFEFNPLHRRAEVGIVIRKTYRHKGYGKKALCQLANMASSTIGLHQLYAIVSCTNTYAVNLFRSSGFIGQQVLKEWLVSSTGEPHDALLFQRFLKT